jgi:ABC-type branched-subunit amino acid transport system substrate-binding protein
VTAVVSALALSMLTACGGSGESGDAIKVMLIGSLESSAFSTPQTEAAAKTAAAVINENGGINGRDLAVSFCNDKFDPNESVACAQRAADEGVVAVIGGSTGMSAHLPVLEAAGIPLVGGAGSSGAPELKSPISYPVNSGAAVMNYGSGSYAAKKGDSVAILTTDNEGSLEGEKAARKSAEDHGAKVQTFTMKLGAPDASPTAAAALRIKPDAVILTPPPEDAVKMVKALRQGGYTGLIVASSSLFPPSAIEALGEFAEGIVVAGRLVPVTSTDIPEVKAFVDAMQQHASDASLDDLSMNTWTAFQLFAKVLEGKEVDGPRDVIAALDAVSKGKPIELGTAVAYRGIQANPEMPDFPRVATFATVFSEIKDGKIVKISDFENPTEKS